MKNSEIMKTNFMWQAERFMVDLSSNQFLVLSKLFLNKGTVLW